MVDIMKLRIANCEMSVALAALILTLLTAGSGLAQSDGGVSVGPYPQGGSGGSASVATNIVNGWPDFVFYGDASNTVSLYTNGFSGGRTIMQFPASQSFGFNEVNAMFTELTNSLHVGYKADLFGWNYTSSVPLCISNSLWVCGIGSSRTVINFAIPTNTWTQSQITNIVSSGQIQADNALAVSLISIKTNSTVIPSGDETYQVYNVKLSGFSIKTLTNTYCVGITFPGGDYSEADDVIVGGPQLWTSPSYWNGWLSSAQVPAPSQMVGWVIGQNQPTLNACAAVGCADGLIGLHNSFVRVDRFYAEACGRWSGGYGTAFPATSELSLGAGYLQPKASTVANVELRDLLTYKCGLPIAIIGGNRVTLYNWNDQSSTVSAICELTNNGIAVNSFGGYHSAPYAAITNSAAGWGVNISAQPPPNPMFLSDLVLDYAGGMKSNSINTVLLFTTESDVVNTYLLNFGNAFTSYARGCITNNFVNSYYSQIENAVYPGEFFFGGDNTGNQNDSALYYRSYNDQYAGITPGSEIVIETNGAAIGTGGSIVDDFIGTGTTTTYKSADYFVARKGMLGNGSGLNLCLTNKVLIAQTTTNAIFQYTVPAGVTNTYTIGGSLNVTAITTDVIKMSVLFTDENNVAQNDSLAASFSGTGFNSIASQSIRAKGGTVITVTTYLTTSTGSQTFDVNAFLSSVQ